MICSKCGKEIDDNSKFCDGCGEKLEMVNMENVTEQEIPDTPAVEPVKEVVEKAKEKEKPVKKEKEEKVKDVSLTKPIGIFGFIWMFILMSIPVVNIVMVLIWAFSSHKNTNKKNFAWAMIILFLVMSAITVFLFIQFSLNIPALLDELTSLINGI